MISDSDLYRLAIFLGCASAFLIIVYHFIEVNASKVTSPGKVLAKQEKSTATGEATR
jgi:oligosaccharyl transferase complex subunit OST4